MTLGWDTAPRAPRGWHVPAARAVEDEVRAGGRPLVSAATGSGKSDLCCYLVRRAASRGPVVVAVPTQALVRQLAASLAAWVPDVGVWYADERRLGAGAGVGPVVVVCCYASLETLPELPGLRLLLFDEAHLSETERLRGVVERLAPRAVVGVTATPYRTDGRALGLFTRCVFRYTLEDATRDGVLVPLRRVWWDGRGVDATDVDGVCLRLIREAPGPGVVDAVTIEDAEAFAARLTAEGVPAAAVHSGLSAGEVAARLEALRVGALRCVVHVAMLVAGVDLPWLRWLCLRRPVGSVVRLVQQIGRILRVAPGKDEARVLDVHDVLAALGLRGEESVGVELAAALDRLAEREVSPEPAAPEPVRLPPAVAVTELQAWARRALLALVEAGVAEAPAAGGWRAGWASERQVARLEHGAKVLRWVPEEAREGLRVTIAAARSVGLTAGQASDLIVLLEAVEAARARAIERHPGRWVAVQRSIGRRLAALPVPPAEPVAALRRAA